MKRILILVAFTAATFAVNAQNLPKDGYTGLGFSVTGLSNVMFGNYGSTALSGVSLQDPYYILILDDVLTLDNVIPQNTLMLKCYYEDGLASRLTLGINSISAKNFSGDSTALDEYTESENKLSGFSFGLGAGLEKHMATDASKVDPYLGAEVLFAMLTGFNFESTSDVVGDGYSSSSMTDISYPGGIGFALNLLGGFNYFFSDNISIGGEVGLGFGMMRTGGEWTMDSENSSTIGGTTTTTTSSDRGEYKSSISGVNVNSFGGVNLMIYW